MTSRSCHGGPRRALDRLRVDRSSTRRCKPSSRADGDVQTIDDRTDGTWDPRWTPDGSAIVYSAKIGDDQYQIFRTELDDTPPVPIGPVFAGPISATEWFR